MAIALTRTDPTRNMARFYRLDMQPTLFGETALICEWGRIGCRGRTRETWFAEANTAARVLAQQGAKKRRRGYR